MVSYFTKNWKKLFTSSKEHKSTAQYSTLYLNNKGEIELHDRDYGKFAADGYICNVVANFAANTIAKAIISIPTKLMLYDATGASKQIYQHKILNLLRKPNLYISGVNFMESIVLHLLISGNAYILKVRDGSGQIQELHNLRPDRVSIITNNNHISSYQYQINNETYDYPINPKNGQCELMHIKNFHPLDDYRGLSMLEAALYSIEQHNQTSLWTFSLLKNSARPSGALIVKNEGNGRLTELERQSLKEQLDQLFSSAQNSGRPLLLEGGMEWKEMSLSPRDMDFINAKNNVAREIMIALGVPTYLLGIPGDNTYNNLAEAKHFFYENTILPTLMNIHNHFNNWFAHDFPQADLRLEYDRSNIGIFIEQQIDKWRKLEGITYLTVNEKRALAGYPPITEEDKLKT